VTSNQNLEDTAVAVRFDAIREHVPITFDRFGDSDEGDFYDEDGDMEF
jgi:hypothetical protein